MLTFGDYITGIETGGAMLRRYARAAGPSARVPTCPDWTVGELVAHQGTVHRWAASHLRTEPIDEDETEREGLDSPNQLDWFDYGVRKLVQTLKGSPDDLDAYFFLHDPPPAKLAWARRQCHETTIHAVDALSAALERRPTAADTWIEPALAGDGIDELLTGFLPRRRQQVRSTVPQRVLVETTDTSQAWTMIITEEPVITLRKRTDHDHLVSGTAVELYLALWNRSEVANSAFLSHWRHQMQISWT